MNQLISVFSKILLVLVFVCGLNTFSQAQISTQVGVGALYINGDIDPVKDAFNSFHLALSKKIKNNWNAELKIGLGKAIGLSGSFMETAQNGGGLVEDVYSFYEEKAWYPNYISDYKYVDLGVNYILNTGIPRLSLIGGGGVGVSFSRISINLLNLEGDRYDEKLPETTPIDEVKDYLNFRYDPSYETTFDDGGGVTPHLTLQLGLQIRITKGIFFRADVRYHLTAFDYLDPITNVTSTEVSGNNDSVSMFTIGFMGNLLPDEKEDRELVK